MTASGYQSTIPITITPPSDTERAFEFDSARTYLAEARELFGRPGAREYLLNNFILTARLLLAEGNRPEALEALDQADAISRDR